MRSALPGIAETLVALAALVLPRRHREWADAMREEFAQAEPRDRASWAAGCLFAACRTRATEPSAIYAAAVGLFAVLLVAVDWNTANDTLTLCVLVLIAALLGYLRPDRTILASFCVGMCLLTAHAFANFTGWHLPFYQCKPLTLSDFLVLSALAFPAFAGAKAGAVFRELRMRLMEGE